MGSRIERKRTKKKGFEISISKTVAVSIDTLYNSWIENKQRNKWLKEKITIRKATKNKSARITWSVEDTSLSVDFYPKGETKSQVVVQHLKIPDAKKAVALKAFWLQHLDVLKTLLEK